MVGASPRPQGQGFAAVDGRRAPRTPCQTSPRPAGAPTPGVHAHPSACAQIAACISGNDVINDLAILADHIADILWCS